MGGRERRGRDFFSLLPFCSTGGRGDATGGDSPPCQAARIAREPLQGGSRVVRAWLAITVPDGAAAPQGARHYAVMYLAPFWDGGPFALLGSVRQSFAFLAVTLHGALPVEKDLAARLGVVGWLAVGDVVRRFFVDG